MNSNVWVLHRLLPVIYTTAVAVFLHACGSPSSSNPVGISPSTASQPAIAGNVTASPSPKIILPPVTTGQRTYHLGNSLTDSVNDLLEPIAQSAGYKHDFLRSTIPGAPTDWNWDHPGEASGEPDYRVVFDTKAPIDQLFVQPFAGHDRSIENETDYSGRFYHLAQKKSPNVQLWIYAQWPAKDLDDSWSKAEGSVEHLGLTPAKTWEDGVRNQLAYHEALRQHMQDLNKGKPILIVPGGPTLVELKRAIAAGQVPGTTDFFDTLFEDDVHLNSKGQYFISLVHYICIYRRNPAGVTFADTGLTAEQAAAYQRIAWDAVRRYRWSGVAE
jgi:hypothetical protein